MILNFGSSLRNNTCVLLFKCSPCGHTPERNLYFPDVHREWCLLEKYKPVLTQIYVFPVLLLSTLWSLARVILLDFLELLMYWWRDKFTKPLTVQSPARFFYFFPSWIPNTFHTTLLPSKLYLPVLVVSLSVANPEPERYDLAPCSLPLDLISGSGFVAEHIVLFGLDKETSFYLCTWQTIETFGCYFSTSRIIVLM